MKQFITIALILTFGVLYAQNPSEKTTVPRKVILENFTTGQCPNCPPIHVYLEDYAATHPNAIVIAQHAGFGTDIMTIPENTELLALYNAGGSTFAPGLAIDRHHYPTPLPGDDPRPGSVFWPGGSTSATTTRIEERLAVPSNISLDITYTNNSGVLDIDVQGEILETVVGNDLRLVLYIIEDGIIAPQSGGSSNYVHNNVMRDAISGTWGDAGIITSNTSGTTFSEQYTYTPDTSWILHSMSLVAFVANYDTGNVNNREILQADKLSLAAPIGTNNVALMGVTDMPDTCDYLTSPSLSVTNLGSADITSLDIDYSINGGNTTGTYNWSGSPISLFDQADIVLEDISFALLNVSNDIDFDITHVNGVADDDTSNNTLSSSFNEAPEAIDESLQILINTDGNGAECTWTIEDSTGTVVESGGPYGNNETINAYPVLLHDCYTFSIFDAGGNGGGTVIVADSNSTPLYYSTGNYGAGETQEFVIPDVGQSVEDEAFASVILFPNPTNATLNIENANGLSVAIVDVLGRELFAQEINSTKQQINVENFAEGTYIVRLTDGVKIRTVKIVISR